MNAPVLLALASLVAASPVSRGDVRLPSIFSEHMVLLRSAATPIWGKADPNERVAVTMNGRSAEAVAGADGRWKVTLDLADAGPGPFEMTVTGSNKLVIPDVVVGQVWLASGQSNMERTMDALAQVDEIAHSANPLLRQFRVDEKGADTPQDDCNGQWSAASPLTTGDFTALGYYFGKKLQAELRQPVGLVNVSWGGTQVESWLSPEAVAKDPTLAEGAKAVAAQIDTHPAKKLKYVTDYGAWLKANAREDKPCPDPSAYAGERVNTADWTPVTLPGKIAGPGLPAAGAVWLRKEIVVPEGAQVQSINGALGQITGFETVYWNGKKVSETTYSNLMGEDMGRNFGIPQTSVHPGKAILAVRIFAPVGAPRIVNDPFHFIAGPISLAGSWLAKAEYSLPELAPAMAATAPKAPPNPPKMKASNIYNGVVHPVIPYGLAGILWYQGESNAGYAYQYRAHLALFINDIRQHWGDPTLPFYMCQLPCFGPKVSTPGQSVWAEARESQTVASQLPNTSEAVLIDLGETADTHPRDKRTPADRLLRIALARNYGRKEVDSGPFYQSMEIEGPKIRIHFTHIDGGLIARRLPKTYDVRRVVHETAPLIPNSPGSQLEGFAICGSDRNWLWANARIEKDTVLVWSNEVPQPVAVRYAWADSPTCNLYNGGGLPAAPFRTDDFPLLTQQNRFGLPALPR